MCFSLRLQTTLFLFIFLCLHAYTKHNRRRCVVLDKHDTAAIATVLLKYFCRARNFSVLNHLDQGAKVVLGFLYCGCGRTLYRARR